MSGQCLAFHDGIMKELQDLGLDKSDYNSDEDDDDELFLEKDQKRRDLIKAKNRIKHIQDRKYRQTMPVNASLDVDVTISLSSDAKGKAFAGATPPQSAPADPKRALIVQELVTTERSYLESLMRLVTQFMVPCVGECVISTEDAQLLFSNTESLYKLHSEFLSYLEEAYTSDGSIGKLFVQFGPMLRLYKEYAAEHDKALVTLERLVNKVTFVDFCKTPMGVDEASPESVYLHIASLLITPIQRIPRYLLLFKDLIAHTDPSSEEYANLEKAAALLSEIATEVNQCKLF